MKLFFCQNSPQIGQSFWQKNGFITQILFAVSKRQIYLPLQMVILHKLCAPCVWHVNFPHHLRQRQNFCIWYWMIWNQYPKLRILQSCCYICSFVQRCYPLFPLDYTWAHEFDLVPFNFLSLPKQFKG